MDSRTATATATAPIYAALIAEHGDVPGQVRKAAAEVEREEHDVLDFSAPLLVSALEDEESSHGEAAAAEDAEAE